MGMTVLAQLYYKYVTIFEFTLDTVKSLKVAHNYEEQRKACCHYIEQLGHARWMVWWLVELVHAT